MKKKALLVLLWAVLLGLTAVASPGCSMAKPVSIVVEKGYLEIEGIGKVQGERIRYRSGLLEAGEAGVTFDGRATGFPASGPAPAPAPAPAPVQ